MYSDRWLKESGLLLTRGPVEPVKVSAPADGLDHGWSYLNWSRRSLAEVLGGEPALEMQLAA